MLKIQDIQYFEVKIPFTRSFKHGSAERNVSETILVQIKDYTGLVGYGEGCPRSYVTGESIATVSSFLKKHHLHVQKIKDLNDINEYLSDNRSEIDNNPSAWCAVELALLDLLAKTESVNVETLLGRTVYQSEYSYSAILGDSSPEEFHKLFLYYRQLGFIDYKIKLSNDIVREREKLDCMRKYMYEITVRADANNLWDSTTTAINYLSDLSFQFLAIEEPIQSKQIEGLPTIADKAELKIILDESFLKFSQIELLMKNSPSWIVNARVSKYGGILRSLEIIDELVRADIEVIVGAHVGETSLLTRAALILADAASHKLRAQEGGFSTHLLTKDLFEPNLKISKGGMFEKALLNCRDEPGFGLKINNTLENMSEVTNLNINCSGI